MSVLAGMKSQLVIDASIEEVRRESEVDLRRLYLYGAIEPLDEDVTGPYCSVSTTSRLVEVIMDINRKDAADDIPPEKRTPIRLYINSPGGDITEGFALVSAIELSKTPVWTINIGQWCSMAFLIGISGHKRFSMPNMTFLMHEGMAFAGGAASKMQDRAKFDERFKDEVIKQHILRHSKMDSAVYDASERVELYMLPEDALKYGFIDEIVTDIDVIF
ncbi:MAG: ATP-dependent Clp protease proteolytic subunit [Candidatus Saccharibacteria bacterium]|nr:ATP-dependent Clp protease proteolytic subunit [Candidatus Saccharibacteria bacterium]